MPRSNYSIVHVLFLTLSELGQLSGIAAILRFPMDDEDSDEDD